MQGAGDEGYHARGAHTQTSPGFPSKSQSWRTVCGGPGQRILVRSQDRTGRPRPHPADAVQGDQKRGGFPEQAFSTGGKQRSCEAEIQKAREKECPVAHQRLGGTSALCQFADVLGHVAEAGA